MASGTGPVRGIDGDGGDWVASDTGPLRAIDGDGDDWVASDYPLVRAMRICIVAHINDETVASNPELVETKRICKVVFNKHFELLDEVAFQKSILEKNQVAASEKPIQEKRVDASRLGMD